MHPKFVQAITEKLLELEFSVTGLNTRQYELYLTSYDTLAVFRRSFAFTLTFDELVFNADWDAMEQVIKSQWCSRVGKGIF